MAPSLRPEFAAENVSMTSPTWRALGRIVLVYSCAQQLFALLLPRSFGRERSVWAAASAAVAGCAGTAHEERLESGENPQLRRSSACRARRSQLPCAGPCLDRRTKSAWQSAASLKLAMADLRQPAALARTDTRRQAARACGNLHDALAGLAGASDRGGFSARL